MENPRKQYEKLIKSYHWFCLTKQVPNLLWILMGIAISCFILGIIHENDPLITGSGFLYFILMAINVVFKKHYLVNKAKEIGDHCSSLLKLLNKSGYISLQERNKLLEIQKELGI